MADVSSGMTMIRGDRILIAGVLALVMAALTACAPVPDLPLVDTVSDESVLEPYRLRNGDQVRIIVFGQPDLSQTYTVANQGQISVPLVGAVQAAGRTTAELEQELGERLADGFMVNPSVSAEITAYRPFYILGQVEAPGEYEYRPDMTVLTAVSLAGGFTERAYTHVFTISRRIGDELVEARATPTSRVFSGDVIQIHERYF